MDLVILDELGYLPFSQVGGALLFNLMSKLYEKTSLIITTNLSHNQAIRVGQFSVQIPGHFSVQINNLTPAAFAVNQRQHTIDFLGHQVNE